MPAMLTSPHVRGRDRRVRARAMKSVFVNPPQPARNKYLLTTAEFCAAWGITEYTARVWREAWARDGYHNSPQPRNYSDNGDPEIRYLYDEVCGLPEGTWLEQFRRDREAFIKSTSVTKQTKE